ncbi:MAG: urease accessory protein UreD, partial [Burkholderiales bacterium]|nr:urease accessory protein UreD [Burkholderiales bacterium]
HGLITTPGATRFYRSLGPSAVQSTQIRLSDQARLEWLPLENLCHNDCRAENRLTLDLAPSSEILGWDITALGLPHAQQTFERGSFLQHLEAPGVWLERGEMRATDQRLIQGPAGLAGNACLGTLFFVTGSPIDRQRRSAALELAQTLLQTHALRARAGVTSPNERVLVLRVLAPLVEPVGELLRQLWAGWRQVLWQLGCDQPRIWAT